MIGQNLRYWKLVKWFSSPRQSNMKIETVRTYTPLFFVAEEEPKRHSKMLEWQEEGEKLLLYQTHDCVFHHLISVAPDSTPMTSLPYVTPPVSVTATTALPTPVDATTVLPSPGILAAPALPSAVQPAKVCKFCLLKVHILSQILKKINFLCIFMRNNRRRRNFNLLFADRKYPNWRINIPQK